DIGALPCECNRNSTSDAAVGASNQRFHPGETRTASIRLFAVIRLCPHFRLTGGRRLRIFLERRLRTGAPGIGGVLFSLFSIFGGHAYSPANVWTSKLRFARLALAPQLTVIIDRYRAPESAIQLGSAECRQSRRFRTRFQCLLHRMRLKCRGSSGL